MLTRSLASLAVLLLACTTEATLPQESSGVAITSLTIAPDRVSPDDQVTLRWSTISASSCALLSAAGRTDVSADGTLSLFPEESSGRSEFVLLCQGQGGPAERRVSVEITPRIPQVAIHRFEVSPQMILPGQQATLSWRTANARECWIDPEVGSLGEDASGQWAVLPRSATLYTLSCRGTGGVVRNQVTVQVAPPSSLLSPRAAAEPVEGGGPRRDGRGDRVSIRSFLATPAALVKGSSATLHIGASNATSCSISAGVGAIAQGGGRPVVSPGTTTQYILTCEGEGGPVRGAVTVSVGQPPTSLARLSLSGESGGAGEPLALPLGAAPALEVLATYTDGTSEVLGAELFDWHNATVASQAGQPVFYLERYADLETAGAGWVGIDSFTATPASLDRDQSSQVTLRYSVRNPSSCTLDHGIGVLSVAEDGTGSFTVNGVAVQRTYTLRCEGLGGPVLSRLTVPVVRNTVAAIQQKQDPQGGATLTWAAQNVQGCSITPEVGAASSHTGTALVRPDRKTTYTLSCAGPSGTVISSLTVHGGLTKRSLHFPSGRPLDPGSCKEPNGSYLLWIDDKGSAGKSCVSAAAWPQSLRYEVGIEVPCKLPGLCNQQKAQGKLLFLPAVNQDVRAAASRSTEYSSVEWGSRRQLGHGLYIFEAQLNANAEAAPPAITRLFTQVVRPGEVDHPDLARLWRRSEAEILFAPRSLAQHREQLLCEGSFPQASCVRLRTSSVEQNYKEQHPPWDRVVRGQYTDDLLAQAIGYRKQAGLFAGPRLSPFMTFQSLVDAPQSWPWELPEGLPIPAHEERSRSVLLSVLRTPKGDASQEVTIDGVKTSFLPGGATLASEALVLGSDFAVMHTYTIAQIPDGIAFFVDAPNGGTDVESAAPLRVLSVRDFQSLADTFGPGMPGASKPWSPKTQEQIATDEVDGMTLGGVQLALGMWAHTGMAEGPFDRAQTYLRRVAHFPLLNEKASIRRPRRSDFFAKPTLDVDFSTWDSDVGKWWPLFRSDFLARQSADGSAESILNLDVVKASYVDALGKKLSSNVLEMSLKRKTLSNGRKANLGKIYYKLIAGDGTESWMLTADEKVLAHAQNATIAGNRVSLHDWFRVPTGGQVKARVKLHPSGATSECIFYAATPTVWQVVPGGGDSGAICSITLGPSAAIVSEDGSSQAVLSLINSLPQHLRPNAVTLGFVLDGNLTTQGMVIDEGGVLGCQNNTTPVTELGVVDTTKMSEITPKVVVLWRLPAGASTCRQNPGTVCDGADLMNGVCCPYNLLRSRFPAMTLYSMRAACATGWPASGAAQTFPFGAEQLNIAVPPL